MFKEARQGLKAAFNTATGGNFATTLAAARIFLGWRSTILESLSIYKDVETNGPLAVIGCVKNATAENIEGGGQFTVDAKIYVYKNKKTSFTMGDIDDLLESLFSRCRDQTVFDVFTVICPGTMNVNNIEWDYDSHKGLVCIDMSFTFPDP